MDGSLDCIRESEGKATQVSSPSLALAHNAHREMPEEVSH